MGPRYQSFSGAGCDARRPSSRYARTTPAVFSGRSVTRSPERVSNVYISLPTMSVASPTPRSNSSVFSKRGVRISEKHALAITRRAASSIRCQRSISGATRSRVPRRARSSNGLVLPAEVPPRGGAGHVGQPVENVRLSARYEALVGLVERAEERAEEERPAEVLRPGPAEPLEGARD